MSRSRVPCTDATLTYAAPALTLIWIVHRQFVGRFVSPGMSPALPLILLVPGVEQAAAGIAVTAAGGIAFIAAVGGWSTPVAFCVHAVLTAGARLPATAAVAITTAVGYAYRHGLVTHRDLKS